MFFSDKAKIIAGLLVLISFTLTIVSLSGYNSDALYVYSQARDIYQFGSLRGWTYSAIPFFFPDALLTLPLAGIIHNPLTFYFVASPIAILFFVGLLSRYISQENKVSYCDTFLSISITVALVGFTGSFFLKQQYYFLVQPFFIFNTHGFAAIAALLGFLYCMKDSFLVLRSHRIISIVILGLLSLSDFYFCVYFGLLILAGYKRDRLPEFLSVTFFFGIFSILIFIASYKINPSLAEQIHNSTTQINERKWENILLSMIYITIPGIALIWMRIKGFFIPIYVKRLFLGLVLIVAFINAAGLLHDKYTFRYLTILFAGSIVIFSYILARLSTSKKLLIAVFCLIASLIIITRANFVAEKPMVRAYHDEIQCIHDEHLPGSSIVAQYWPAKIIFESLDRKYNLIQVNGDLNEMKWISNILWRTMYPDNQVTFIVTDQLSGQIIKALETEHQASMFCGGKLLKINESPSKFLPFKF